MSIDYDTVTILTTRLDISDKGDILAANLVKYSIDVPDILDQYNPDTLEKLVSICNSVELHYRYVCIYNIIELLSVDRYIAIEMYESIKRTDLGQAIII